MEFWAFLIAAVIFSAFDLEWKWVTITLPGKEKVINLLEHTYAGDCPGCDPCESEFIDGSYSDCGCCKCAEDEGKRIERAVEMGALSESEARDAHILNGTWSQDPPLQAILRTDLRPSVG